MKTIRKVALCLTASLLLAACGSNQNKGHGLDGSGSGDNPGIVSDSGSQKPVEYGKVDIDLTLLSATMVYSEVFHMLESPRQYVGKVIKASGAFSALSNTAMTQFYPAVIIKDATACCANGLEFVLQGNPKYPEGYPPLGENITVVGRFEIYYEGLNQYCHLVEALILAS